MKKHLFFLFSLYILLSLTSCPDESESEDTSTSSETPTPVVDDFNIEGLGVFYYERNVTRKVTITPKAGKTTGAISVRYNNSIYENGPSERGTYTVTFNVAAAEGWNEAYGLAAGTLEINNLKTPTLNDYEVAGLGTFIYNGAPRTVTFTPKAGASPGLVTIQYNKTSAAPLNVGEYAVTINVEKVPEAEGVQGWNPVLELSAGTVKITTATPALADYEISGLEFNYDGQRKPVTVTVKPGADKSRGLVSVWYEGLEGNSAPYAKRAAAPLAVGSYAVTFDVARELPASLNNWNAATISAGTLTIKSANTNTYTVTFVSNGGPSVGDITNVPHGGAIIEPEEIFKTLTGNDQLGKLDGWYKEPALTNIWRFDSDSDTLPTDTVTSGITLYAKWRTYAIGDRGPAGGVIFYHAPNGFTVKGYTGATGGFAQYTAHYLEEAGINGRQLYDFPFEESQFSWASNQNGFQEKELGGTEWDVGTGRRNTAVILAKDPIAPAAKACTACRVGGFDDWFLPSIEELDLMYKNLRANDLMVDVENLSYIYTYWSSTEFNNAWAYWKPFGLLGMTVVTGETYAGPKRSTSIGSSISGSNARPVRAF